MRFFIRFTHHVSSILHSIVLLCTTLHLVMPSVRHHFVSSFHPIIPSYVHTTALYYLILVEVESGFWRWRMGRARESGDDLGACCATGVVLWYSILRPFVSSFHSMVLPYLRQFFPPSIRYTLPPSFNCADIHHQPPLFQCLQHRQPRRRLKYLPNHQPQVLIVMVVVGWGVKK